MIINKIFHHRLPAKRENYASTNYINQNNKLTYDAISFNGVSHLSKKAKFDKLSAKEKKEFVKLIKYIFKNEKAFISTLMGVKPSTLIYGSDFEKHIKPGIKKYKNLLESKDIKIISGKDSGGYDNCFVFNIPKFKKNVEKNLDFYRSALQIKNLKADEIVKGLTKKNSVLFQENDHAILGVTLGYPAPDSIMHAIDCGLLNFVTMFANLGKYPQHAKTLAKISTLFDSQFTKFKENRIKKRNLIPEEANLVRAFIGVKPFKEQIFKVSKEYQSHSPYYMFRTYCQAQETKEMVKEIKAGIKMMKAKFKTPKDLLDYILSPQNSNAK